MPEEVSNVCAECGARLQPDATVCDLCGLDVATDAPEPMTPPVAPAPPEGHPEAAERPVFCHQCGWRNPPAARFCSQCGTRLQDLRAPIPDVPGPERAAVVVSPPPIPDEESNGKRTPVPKGMGRQLGLLIGTAVLLVAGLYLITYVSKQRTAEAVAAATVAEAPPPNVPLDAGPLPPQIQERAEALDREIAEATGAARLDRQRELINLYIGAGRVDRAAPAQQALAESVDTPDAWVRTGDLYAEWMERVDEPSRPTLARAVISAYQRVLDEQPDNLDVRTSMAWAYQYDPTNPMEAIAQTNAVLEADPDHVRANFNRAYFLLRIGRTEQAFEQLERVKTLAGEGTPIYNQAEQLMEMVRAQQTDASS